MKTTILAEIERKIIAGTIIPKPQGRADFIVKGWGVRRGERALIYTISNHKAPTKPYQKGISVSEWVQAFEQLTNAVISAGRGSSGPCLRAPRMAVATLQQSEGFSNFSGTPPMIVATTETPARLEA